MIFANLCPKLMLCAFNSKLRGRSFKALKKKIRRSFMNDKIEIYIVNNNYLTYTIIF